jgi:hypothetical protein
VVGRRVLASLFDWSLVTLLSSVAFAPLLFAQPGLILVLVLLLSFVLLFCNFLRGLHCPARRLSETNAR